jgi:hypothetical protein
MDLRIFDDSSPASFLSPRNTGRDGSFFVLSRATVVHACHASIFWSRLITASTTVLNSFIVIDQNWSTETPQLAARPMASNQSNFSAFLLEGFPFRPLPPPATVE